MIVPELTKKCLMCFIIRYELLKVRYNTVCVDKSPLYSKVGVAKSAL